VEMGGVETIRYRHVQRLIVNPTCLRVLKRVPKNNPST